MTTPKRRLPDKADPKRRSATRSAKEINESIAASKESDNEDNGKGKGGKRDTPALRKNATKLKGLDRTKRK